MCRFHCCLAAHQRTRKKDSAEPSFPILWTPPHPPGGPLRRGNIAAAVDRDIVSCIPVQTVCPHFDVVFGGSVFGLVSFAFQKITLGIGSFVFHYWMEKRRCSDGFVVSFFGLPLTATLYQFCWVQAHFINVAGCKNVGKMRSYSLYFKKTGIPYRLNL